MSLLDALSETSGVPFWQQIRDQLAARIGTGKLTAGQPLPSIRELAAELLVSVITVKKAYDELEHLGLVHSRQGRGTFVAEGGDTAARVRAERDALVLIDSAVGQAAAAGASRAQVESTVAEAVQKRYP